MYRFFEKNRQLMTIKQKLLWALTCSKFDDCELVFNVFTVVESKYLNKMSFIYVNNEYRFLIILL